MTLFGSSLLGLRSIPLTSNHFLASGPTGPRPILLFGTDFERTGAYTPLWLRVFGEPRGLKLGSNCKNVTASLYASVPGQPRHIRRDKMEILHMYFILS